MTYGRKDVSYKVPATGSPVIVEIEIEIRIVPNSEHANPYPEASSVKTMLLCFLLNVLD
jgi:hypothetical protein